MAKKKLSTKVIRIKETSYNKLEKLKPEGMKVSAYLEGIIDDFAKMLESPEYYLVSERVFTDLADARGEAIIQSVRNKQPVQFPKIAVVMGEDHGG